MRLLACNYLLQYLIVELGPHSQSPYLATCFCCRHQMIDFFCDRQILSFLVGTELSRQTLSYLTASKLRQYFLFPAHLGVVLQICFLLRDLIFPSYLVLASIACWFSVA